jgi:hypothetical protein
MRGGAAGPVGFAFYAYLGLWSSASLFLHFKHLQRLCSDLGGFGL